MLVGALAGAGLAGSGREVDFANRWARVLFIPCSSVLPVAVLLGAIVYGLFRWFKVPSKRNATIDRLH